MKKLITSIFALLSLNVAFTSQPRKVLIIGIDGLRADALQQANTPNIDNLIAGGFYTYESWHEGITVSGPSWSTIMTGVEYEKHGVTSNSYSGSNYNTYPYFPTLAKSCLQDLYAVQIVQWAPMSDNVYNDGWDLKLKVCDGCGANSVSAAQTQLANPNLDVLFTYFDECDLTGHASGFSPLNPAYMSVIEIVDSHIGNIMTALYNRPNYANEDWIVLLTTDHGGIGNGHGGNTNQERRIWWIGSGNNPVANQLTGIQDPGSRALGNFNQTLAAQNPSQDDIAVTALDHLFRGTACNPFNPAWDFDGQSWLDSLHQETSTNSLDNIISNDFNFKTFPNPSTDIVSVWFENEANEAINYKLVDNLGNIVEEKNNVSPMTKNKLNIDVSNKSAGEYFITLFIGGKSKTNKIVIK